MTKFVLAFSLALVSATGTLLAQDPAPKPKSKSSAAANPFPNAEKSALGTLRIDGNPSTLIACTGGKHYTTQPLGFATAGTRVRVDVLSGDGIDPVASLVVLQMGGQHPDGTARASFSYDDDSGGNFDPRIDFTLPFDGNVVLNVGSFDGSFGCYWVRVQVTP